MANVYVLLALFCVVASCLAVTDEEINKFLNVCIDSKYHKDKPGPEADVLNQAFHCTPWQNNSCCTANTTFSIQKDGLFSLYRLHWDQCNRTMSAKCRRYFRMDACMFECSPFMKPWIKRDARPSLMRKERLLNVPMCTKDCDEWFDACKDDYTCSDNWGDPKTWHWTKQGNMCRMPCKTFKEYHGGPEIFCNKLFDYSWKYTEGKAGEDCMTLWPNGTANINKKVAEKYARKLLTVTTTTTTTTMTTKKTQTIPPQTTKSSSSKLATNIATVILLAGFMNKILI